MQESLKKFYLLYTMAVIHDGGPGWTQTETFLPRLPSGIEVLEINEWVRRLIGMRRYGKRLGRVSGGDGGGLNSP